MMYARLSSRAILFSLLLFFALPLSSIQSASALVKSGESSTVYFLDETGERHAFPNEDIFFSWYEDFSSVVEVSAEALSTYPLGKNMKMKPCTSLVKVISSPDVYAVESGGVLRLLEEEEQAEEFFGEDWAQIIHDVSDVFWTDYTLGESLQDAYPDGCLVKKSDVSTVYFIQDGMAYAFENEHVFMYSRMRVEQVFSLEDDSKINRASTLIDHSDKFSQAWEKSEIVLNVDGLSEDDTADSEPLDYNSEESSSESSSEPSSETDNSSTDSNQSAPPSGDETEATKEEDATQDSESAFEPTKSLTFVEREYYDQFSDPLDTIELKSMFGSRIASETNAYDFHQGMDFAGTLGDSVYAITDGEIFRTYTESDVNSPYPNSGNIVILRHTSDIPFSHFGTHTEYYSLYAHLDDIAVPIVTSYGPYTLISGGTKIGTLGESGSALEPHVHFEIRIGTTCSYDTQVANPQSACASTFSQPADPRVNPLMFIEYENQNSLNVEIVSENPLTVDVTFDNDELDFNAISVTDDQGKTTTVDFNTRDGIDLSNIDNSTYNGVEIKVDSIDRSSGASHSVMFIFSEIADSWSNISASDVWGNTVTYTQ